MRSSLSRLLARRRLPAIDPVEDEVRRIAQLGVFDREAYLGDGPDANIPGFDPIRHYVTRGVREGRNPCMFFDTAYYYGNNPDVATAGLNPLLHYFEFGWMEGRNPSDGFDAGWYARTHLAAANGTINPLLHYLSIGRAQGLEVRAVVDPVREAILASGLFDADYYREQYPDIAESGIDPLGHYLRHGAREGRNPCAFFDTRYYLRNNGDVAASRINPLLHFCRDGWRELRNPHPEFDVWWYWSQHLDPATEDVNPLAHYLSVGRGQGLDARPDRHVAQRAGSGFRLRSSPRRICLFAGYDSDGVVDDYVVDYLRELSRHADIHYLADCEMQAGELDKIADYVKSARAERHGEYDFGSYSRLAKGVGWGEIGRYDELILANDSCYLLRGLDDVFARMDAKPCDWWGMQATKGMASTRKNPRNRFLQPIPMSTVKLSMLAGFESDYRYDFHVGSYFVAYRKPVIDDEQFRKLLGSVVAQEHKRNIILKYEVGLTRNLVARGFAFDTFIENLYPFHPLYTNWHFCLLDEGFPFLKRYLLSNNHYRVPRLATWAERILRKLPQADVAAIQRNLDRVVEPDKLWANLHVGDDRDIEDEAVPERLLSAEQFLAADQSSPKHGHWWAFPVCAFTHVFSGNERAVFEQVKDDPSIRKIVLTLDREASVDGTNVEVVPLKSPRGQYLLMRSGVIFVKHSPTRNLVYPVAAELHNIINLWHGIPFKRIGHASLDMQDKRRAIAREHAKCRAVISSSKVDSLAMASAFYPLSYGDVWATGLPRNDFILRDFERLPEDFRADEDRLRELCGGKRLVLFMPTFRNGQEAGYYRFTDAEVDWLAGWLERNDAVLGLREHMADSARVYSSQLARIAPLDLSDRDFPNVEVLYRCSSALITDYSSSFIDYMLTGKPAASFAYDLDAYENIERGGFYDLDFAFPGRVCRSFDALKDALDVLFDAPTPAEAATLEWKRRLFFDHVDDRNSERLVSRVKRLSDFEDIGSRMFASGA